MKLFTLVLLTAATVALAGDSAPKPLPDRLGRYRLMHAPVTTRTDKGHIDHNEVFKIDSMTGRTWIYRTVIQEGRPAYGWEELRDLGFLYGTNNAVELGK